MDKRISNSERIDALAQVHQDALRFVTTSEHRGEDEMAGGRPGSNPLPKGRIMDLLVKNVSKSEPLTKVEIEVD